MMIGIMIVIGVLLVSFNSKANVNPDQSFEMEASRPEDPMICLVLLVLLALASAVGDFQVKNSKFQPHFYC